ncbi:hypothetical protein EMIT0P176_40053 [Pseudomonas sp. IT-P176]
MSYNGITPASQADNEGSIPFTRSTNFSLAPGSFLTGDDKKPVHSDRFFYACNSVGLRTNASCTIAQYFRR